MTNDLAIRILSGDILGTTEQTHEAVAMAVKALSALPSADAVEVVRCKDCDSAKCSGVMIYCLTHGRHMRDNDFCSLGKRKESK